MSIEATNEEFFDGKSSKPGHHRLKTCVSVAFTLLVFGAAIATLRHQLRDYSFSDIAKGFSSIPLVQLAVALVFTFVNYFVLTLYDLVALRVIDHPLRYRRIAKTTFVSAVISANLGFHLFTSAPLRFRLYSSYGLSALQIGKVIALNTLTFWMGYFLLGGIFFTFFQSRLPDNLPIASSLLTAIGAGLLACVIVYLALSSSRLSVKFRGRVFRVPDAGTTAVQAAISCLDWIMSALILYVLLPPSSGISFTTVLGYYLLGQVVGLVSNVPGGLGVFETVVLFLLAPSIGAPTTMSVLLAFRVFMYLLPFLVALLLLLGHEIRYGGKALLKRRRAGVSELPSPSIDTVK